MSAFERRRLENIATNQALLTDISATAKKVIPKKPAPAAASKRKPRAEAVKKEPARPTRMSSRLAGVGADDTTLKRKMEVEAEFQASKAQSKKMRINGDLNLGDVVVDGKKYGSSMDGLKDIFRGAEPGLRTFSEDDIKETTDAGLRELRLRMSSLKLYEHWAPNGALQLQPIPQSNTNMTCRYQDYAAACLCAWFSSHRGQADSVCWR